jgi:putative hydrolase of the HAD superfamily
LSELVASGIEVAIVSNSDGWIEGSLRVLGICQVGAGPGASVRAVIDSSLVGVEKPDPRIFEAALRALDLPAGAVVHVGDSVHFDIEGARSAGIRALHFDPFAMCGAGEHEHVSSLAAVRGFLEG